MLGADRLYGTLALVALVAVACGGDAEPTGTGGGSSGDGGSTSSGNGGGGSDGTGGDGSGAGLDCPSGEGTTLALTKLQFGEGNNGEWKKVGFNLDGLVSTSASTDVCQPNAGGPKHADGEDGIDNSFGQNLLPVIIGLYPAWPIDVNNELDIGDFNALLKMYCLPPTGDVPKFTTKLFGGARLGANPKYDGTDLWPVAPELLANPDDPESSTIVFSNASVTGSKFDLGKAKKFILTVPMESEERRTSLKLTLYAPQVTMTLSEDRTRATKGRIGGVLDTEEFITEVNKAGWVFDQCGDVVWDNVINMVRQSSDIMADGTQDPTKTCNGITIGFGFEMREVQLGEVGPPAEVGMSCP
jgi:hypothetical protein